MEKPEASKKHFIYGFLPWIFFGAFSSHSRSSMLLGSFGALVLTLIFNYKELKKSYILPWGSMILFALFTLNFSFGVVHLSQIWELRIVNSALALIVIFSLIIKRPFTLQYAKESVDPKHWNSPIFIRVNWILTSIWAALMVIMAIPSFVFSYETIQNNWFWNYGLMIACIIIGTKSNTIVPNLLKK